MTRIAHWETVDVHLLRVLHALLSENSVSRAARRLNQSQPAISTALRRLRELTGDPILVRCKNGMTPTEHGAALLEPVTQALASIDALALGPSRFEATRSRRVFNIATPDYLSATLMGRILARIHAHAPHCQVAFHSLAPDHDFTEMLEAGEIDMVIGNWPEPPEHLRMTPLFDDDVVCMLRNEHPLANRPISIRQYLEAGHIVPTPYAVGRRGVIDLHLGRERLKRNVVACVPYFNLVPYMVLQSDLIFTGPRSFIEHYTTLLPLCSTRSPVEYPRMKFYLMWHDRSHGAEECRWLREQIVEVSRDHAAQRAAPPRRIPGLAVA